MKKNENTFSYPSSYQIRSPPVASCSALPRTQSTWHCSIELLLEIVNLCKTV